MLDAPSRNKIRYRDRRIALRNRKALLLNDEVKRYLGCYEGLFDFITKKVDLSSSYEEVISIIGNWAEDNSDYSRMEFAVRRVLIDIYGFAIVDSQFSNAVKELGLQVVDLGAGTGYISYELQMKGVDVVAYDISPPKKKSNKYGFSTEWCEVREGGVSVLDSMEDHALLLSWPNYESDFGRDAIEHFNGTFLILIHEGDGGCVGSTEMYELLSEGWDEYQEISIPQWSGIHDYASFFKRRS